MADFVGKARSNYFKVKDRDALAEALEGLDGIEIAEGEDDNEGRVALVCTGGGHGVWPTMDWKAEDVDLPALVAPHLEKDEVAVFIEIGSEKLRYLSGIAEAINHEGKRKRITLDDIYKQAEKLGTNVTEAMY